MSARLLCTLRQTKNIIWLHNLKSFLWDKGAWGHRVLFASTELDLFYYHPWNCKYMEILMIEWAISQHQNKIRIRSYKENPTMQRIWRAALCPQLYPFLLLFSPPHSPSGLHSVWLKFISRSNSEDIPWGLVYSLNWPHSPKSLCAYVCNIRSKSWEPKTICIYFTHLDWSIRLRVWFHCKYIFWGLICLKYLESKGLKVLIKNIRNPGGALKWSEILFINVALRSIMIRYLNCCRKAAIFCLRESFVNVPYTVFVLFC